ncbi:DUF1120 domain-containing protein [Enterobacter chuandaensis]|uniref:DUF1120 domain-containing protein n=1 Tax=Enterobacter chuandaensis TaxID=2497875 RepID=UPI002074B29F|nr:DUF1120 domain-containing protein [Enterobacter chuandaensis]MCM7588019.1 DUF1120 domain-containing protein [Enterobacter chuandaensis]
MTFTKTVAAILATGLSGSMVSVYAADNFNINVTGLISPAACEASITGGEIIDYGHIPAQSLSPDEMTLLAPRTTGFTVVCQAPTRLGFKATDNRMSTRLTDNSTVITLDNGAVWTPLYMHGLGTDSQGNKIGGWSASLTQTMLDTVSGPVAMYTTTNGMIWHEYPNRILNFLDRPDQKTIYAFSQPDTLSPVAFRSLSATLDVQAMIAQASTLDLSQPVTLDGSITVEMVYL